MMPLLLTLFLSTLPLGFAKDSQKVTANPVDEIFNSLSKGLDERALVHWFRALDGGSFSKTPSGKALAAYLLFQNGLEIEGIESLFLTPHPKSISKKLRALWRSQAPASHPVWGRARLRWSSSWTAFFDRETELAVRSYSTENLGEKEIRSLLAGSGSKATFAKSRLRLALALRLATEEKGMTPALKILKALMADSSGSIDKNLVALSMGRIFYAKKRWAKAMESYDKVSKDSEYWFTAREETAWTLMALGKTKEVVGVTNTLMHSDFSPHLSAETVFLHAYSQLNACDYLGVAESVDIFKRRFKKKVKALGALGKEGKWKPGGRAEQLFQELKKEGKTGLLALGKTALLVPRYVSRDELLLREAQVQKSLDKGIARLNVLGTRYGNTKDASGRSVRKAAARLKKSLRARYERSKKVGFRLLAKRSNEEIQEIGETLFKMDILETEMLQRAAIALARGGREATVEASGTQGPKKTPSGKKTGGTMDRYALNFPFTGEMWFDELNHYRLDPQKICQKRRAL
ncbi:MAG: hypothetical protein OXB88_00785 [Bacteriovoracales bacterium]|nr:hypothetical protein [Bacteriovoracales bacterium]